MGNIIIAGGGLVNKGAQAMTLICVCELKKRFPGHRLQLLVWDDSPDAQKCHAPYDLELLQIPPLKFAGAAGNPLKRALYALRYGRSFTDTDHIYRNTDFLVDISGYALGSNWSEKVCNDYLDNIEHALAYGIPVFLLPQSFGPFLFEGPAGRQIDARIRKLLPQVKLICAREEEGYLSLQRDYGLQNNTVLCKDMVLSSGLRDYTPALREPAICALPDIVEQSMCVIPSVRVRESGIADPTQLYCTAIEAGLSRELTVYITCHSTQDMDFCRSIKALFAGEDRVVLLEQDHSCMEFNELVKKFQFVVASRFHAVVHALKNGVPCVTLGWAAKYVELMALFGQEDYLFDLRRETDAAAIQNAVAAMSRNFAKESQKIKAALPALQKETVFDWIKEASS